MAESSRKVDEKFSHMKLDGFSLHDIFVSDLTSPNDIQMVTLPLLMFNIHPQRLEWNRHNNSVIFLITPFIKSVYNILETQRKIRGRHAVHSQGTIGIGKSAAVYTCCYVLRSRQEERIFVTYISCCKN